MPGAETVFLLLLLVTQSDLFCLFSVAAEGYCCSCSHSERDTHTHTLDGSSLEQGSALAENSDNKQHSQETDIHAPGGIRTRNPSKRAAADPHLKPRDHCDRHFYLDSLTVSVSAVQSVSNARNYGFRTIQ
jgi:hypothetical protein